MPAFRPILLSALIRNYGDVFQALFFTAETLRAQRAYLFAHREMTMDKNNLPLRAKWSLLPYGAEAFCLPPSPGKRKKLHFRVLCVSAVSTL
jgi:hypothetical protein